MSSLDNVKHDLDQVREQHNFISDVRSQLQNMVDELQNAKIKLESDESASKKEILSPLLKSSKKRQESVKKQHKQFHNSLQRLGRSIDSSTQSSANRLYLSWNMDQDILNRVIAEHFYREGFFDVGDAFVAESGTQVSSNAHSPFKEIYAVLQSLRARNLDPALAWARQHSTELREAGYGLEFHLHRLRYIELLQGGEKMEDDHENNNNGTETTFDGSSTTETCSPIEYAQRHFGAFAPEHMDDIRRLMGAILYQGRLEDSPYSDLLDDTLYTDVHDEFGRAACSLLGHAADSPLFVSVTAGSKALPSLYKLHRMLGQTPGEGEESGDGNGEERGDNDANNQHAIDFELGPEFQFHSVFACPVSKEQATKENPPVLLPCGHALGKNSMLALAKGPSQRFKCPYCPLECSAAECSPIYF
eukprot:gb/GECH01014308.1/.p1 GENE.gb/GECH01014308.1/~~gb/GECH01014308.1/.p1  ORF type:complete len:418 (+),score=67.70 gb/GECH01014308.1/:1-1254(+)